MKPNNPNPDTSTDDKPFDELYGTSLSKEQTTEAMFNLVNFVEALIRMDRKHKQWLEEQPKRKGASK